MKLSTDLSERLAAMGVYTIRDALFFNKTKAVSQESALSQEDLGALKSELNAFLSRQPPNLGLPAQLD